MTGRFRRVRPYLLALALGVGGGWIANELGVPLGWMVGAMLATGVAAAAGIELDSSRRVRFLVLAFVGIYLGASFTTDVLHWITRSVVSVSAMCVLVAAETLIASFLLARFVRCDAVTSLTACMPGGFSTMVLLADERGGDVQVVSVVQLVRMIMVIMVVSLAARLSFDVDVAFVEPEGLGSGRDYAAAAVLGLIGLAAGMIWRMPVLCMIVPMTLGAILQLSSVTHLESLPHWPLSIALVLLGVSVGCSWKSFRGERLRRLLAAGAALGVFLISASAATAWGLSHLLGLELLPLLLALAPGGVAELSLISVALDIEPAFVVLHHMLRVTLILLTLPFMFALTAGFGYVEKDGSGDGPPAA